MKQAYVACNGNAEIMKVLFGSARGLNVAFDLAKDSTGAFAKELTGTRNATGMMSAEYDKFVDEVGNVNTRLKNSFELTLGDIGKRLMPEYAGIADGLGAVFKGLKVGLDEGTFDPVFNYLAQIGKELASQLQVIGKNLPEAMKGLDFSGLLTALGGLGDALKSAFTSVFGDVDLTTVEGLHDVIQRIIKAFTTLIEITKGIVEGMEPLWKAIGKLREGYEGLDGKTADTIGNILGLGKAFNELANHMGIVKGVLALFTASLFVDVAAGITTIAVASGAAGIAATALSGGLVLALAGSVAYLAYLATQTANLDALSISTKAHTTTLNSQTEQMIQAGVASGKLTQAQADNLIAQLGLVDGIQKHITTTEKNTQTMKDSLLTYDQVMAQIRATRGDLEKIPLSRQITIGVQTDGSSIDKVGNILIKTFPDTKEMTITNLINGQALTDAKKKIDDTIPPEKTMEIQAKIDEAKIKEQSDIIQKSIEWKAKVDIAQIESATKVIEVAFKSVDAIFADTGKTLDALSNTYATLVQAGRGGTSFMEQQIQEESKRRDLALAEEQKLVDAQIDNIKARTAAMKNGQALIQIDGKGLQPQLEAFMFEILKAIQVRANAEGQQFLVGVGA
jgi:hypothetical protein